MRCALFRCNRTRKVIYCEESLDDLYLGSGFPPDTLSPYEIVDWLHAHNAVRCESLKEGYFDNFINTYSKTMSRVL
jgi:hypothetical protein